MEVINEEVYIGVMYAEETIYKLDFSANTLTSKHSFPGKVFERKILSFATNESIYILRAPFSNSSSNASFWKFEPYKFNN
jgi:N-acetylneuraminic acid mutarotase